MIEMGKEYRTRLGECVTLVTVNGSSNTHPVIGEFLSDGEWFVLSWTKDGQAVAGRTNGRDLIEVKPVRVLEMWVNVYPKARPLTHLNPHHADSHGAGRIACVHIRQEYKEGDGLCDSEKT